MSGPPIPESLVSLLHAIAEDKDLCGWLFQLEQVPLPMRQTVLRQMAARMQAAGEEETLSEAVTLLTDPIYYDAACSTLRELYP